MDKNENKPAEQAQGQAAAIPWGNTDARYIAQQRGTGRGENELTDDMVERAFRDGKPPSKMLREFSEASAALAQRAGSVKPKGSTSTNTEIKTWQDHKQDAAIIHPTGLVGTLLPDWYFRDAYEADLRTALEAARAAQPSQPAGAKKEALDDVKTLHRWSSQVERMASIFEDERSLLCHQAAVLLSRIAYTAPPAAVQSLTDEQIETAVQKGYSSKDGIQMDQFDITAVIRELRALIPAQQPDSERDAALEEAAKLCDFQATWAKGEAEDIENSVRYRHENIERQTAAELCAASIRAAMAAPQTKEG